MKQFTDRFLAAIKPHEKKIILREKRGFAFQILPSGSKSFLYIFELCQRKGYFHLGNYPAMSLAEARIAYNDAYNLVKRGIDPRDQRKRATEELIKEREKAEEISNAASFLNRYTFNSLIDEGIPDGYTPITVEQLIAVYYVFYSKVNHSPMTRRNFLYTVQSGIIPSIGKKLLTEVRRKDAIALIQEIASRAPGQAGNVLRAGRQVFEYALQNEWVEYQPFLRITKAVPKARPKSRERTLDDNEIAQAWNAISQAPASNSVKRAIKMVLVTAQRPGEVSQMRSDQIIDRWWTIPSTIAKNGREHRVYLTDTALSLIGNRRGHIFPSTHGKKGHIVGSSLAQAITRGYLQAEEIKKVGSNSIRARKAPYFGMKPWTPHDLRRTARTNMSRLGIIDEHAEEVLNHKKPGIIGVYNKYRYDNEKKAALIAWEKFLLTLLNSEHAMEFA